MKNVKLTAIEKEIMNQFKEWIINDYDTRLGYHSNSSVNHRKQQVQWLLYRGCSEYNYHDRRGLRHSINRFIQFGSTLKGNNNKKHYLEMLNKITENINK